MSITNIPSFLKASLEDSKPLQLTFSQVKDTNIASTSSFKYEPGSSPLKNTQQLNIDWSKFENHTFFSSAEAKVSLAFDQIINGYPFDGTRIEVENFFENLTGFDKWVFDQFPKYKGYLAFSGTTANENPANGFSAGLGTWIKIKDYAGSLYPEISKNSSGNSILNPRDGSSFAVEAQIYLPDEIGDKQVIFQKSGEGNQSIGLYVDSGYSSTEGELLFAITSGSTSLSVKHPVQKDKFNHVCAVWNRETGLDFLDLFVNEKLKSQSKNAYLIHNLSIDGSEILIGSGSSVFINATLYEPAQTFSGSIDELRVFHSARSIQQQEAFAQKSIFASPELKLYYRFNEPPPPLTPIESDQVNSIVLDSSGNSLHGIIQNFTGSLRKNASLDPLNPMIYENLSTTPVLFPAYPETTGLSEMLMLSASQYDRENPNIIVKLIPQHYLQEASNTDNIQPPLSADGVDSYGGQGMPGQGAMSPAQIMVSFLYIWSRFFDEIKLYLDSFSNLRFVDYNKTDNVPDNFLSNLIETWGVYLPPFFNDSTIEQYVDGENIEPNISTSAMSLKDVQNEILRRVLINMPDVIRSKGTQHAIKSFLRAVGIEPNNSMRIREFGGPTTRPLTFSREKKVDTGVMLQFSTGSLVLSPFLSGSRLEPGFPKIAGTMVSTDLFPPYGISNDPNDGMFTSGSWTVEGIFKYTQKQIEDLTSDVQSLTRICNYDISQGTPWEYPGTLTPNLIANLVLSLSEEEQYLTLYFRSGDAADSPLLDLRLDLPPGSFFNNERWNVSFGCTRNDALGSVVSSSYFLRAATQSEGNITWSSTTSSWFYETPTGENNVLREKTSPDMHNFVSMGSEQTFAAVSAFLNDAIVAPPEARITSFDGQASNVRFWSKDITNEEFIEHTRNYKSLGVHDPLINYNFVTTREGSFEKIRIDSLTKQEDRSADLSGNITLLDFTLNELHMSGTGFPNDVKCLVGELFDHSYLSPYFDEAATDEKIRVRGFEDQALIDAAPWASVAPVHEIVASERPSDDTRLSIEFSLIDALNRDIITMFSTFDALENAIGSPELVYSPDYPDLSKLRDIYFNRIKEKLNFQSFFEFFRWFDKSFSRFVEQLVPRKTQFKGTNFVIESHMLERNKLEHLTPEIYLGQEDRSRIRDSILLQQLTGIIKKY
jgi:hypothetical protein